MKIRAITPPKRTEYTAGQKAFNLTLFLLGAFACCLSLKLWFSADAPRLASAAALPLATSLLWMLLAISSAVAKGGRGFCTADIKQALYYLFPKPIPVIIVAVTAYCAALLLNASFYIATPFFLLATICYLTRRSILKNILWTVFCMGFIILFFNVLFNINLP